MMALAYQSTPSPSRGGIKGGGWFGPDMGAKPHPHLASPVKGEEPRGGCGRMVFHG